MLSQFTREGGHPSLADVDFKFESDVYSVGRLDTDSEGLLLLTNDKRLNSELLSPENGHPRTYHAQVEGAPDFSDLRTLQNPLMIKIKGKEQRRSSPGSEAGGDTMQRGSYSTTCRQTWQRRRALRQRR